jgi:cytochrome c biogenesis protein CcdA
MDVLLGFGAGLLTLINPCVLPVLPLVLASATQGGKHGPLALAAGMGITFVVLGMTIVTIGSSIGLDDRLMSQIGAVLMVGFGLVLLVPKLNAQFALATGGLAERADSQVGGLQQSNLGSVFVAGALLGAVWSPCIGPTLGGAISLASQGQSLGYAMTIMASFALGVGTVIVALGYGTREAICSRQSWLQPLAERSRSIMGVVLVAVGLAILFDLHHVIEAWSLQVLPIWLQDLSVAL